MLSIDIGIKNLSFCLFEFEIPLNNLKIIKWDNIDLSEKTEFKCIEIDKKGLCDLKTSYLSKQKLQTLIEIADKYKVKYENMCKKVNLLTLLNDFASSNCFTPIQTTNASKVDLVTIGRNLQHKFDEILCEHLSSIETIIIENQIGPIANKMKTIQGMISQYFIMKNNNIQIEFMSASNKLKDYLPKDKEIKLDYKQRKKLGIQTCLEIINTDSSFKEWEPFFNKHTKKDDLSDCFLQGMWFIKYKL